jgi:anti-sigma-K factor RskA
VDRDQFMRAAALAQLAFLRRAQGAGGSTGAGTGQRMPASLRHRLASQGEALALRQRAPVVRLASNQQQDPGNETAVRPFSAPVQPLPRSWGRAAGLGWALAATLAAALVIVRNEAPVVFPPDAVPVNAVAARMSLVNSAPDVVTLPWARPTAAGYEAVTGDVVWSQSRQQGYLRLANMPVNDPARTQYQLWIVDPERDTRPVDGGVFNVSAGAEVVIPIQAKLQIVAPKAFAITAEQPGGVVVSAGPLLVVASI